MQYRRKSIKQVTRESERGRAWRAAHQPCKQCYETNSPPSHSEERHPNQHSLKPTTNITSATTPGEASASAGNSNTGVKTKSMTKSAPICTPENMKSHEPESCQPLNPTAEPVYMESICMTNQHDSSLLAVDSENLSISVRNSSSGSRYDHYCSVNIDSTNSDSPADPRDSDSDDQCSLESLQHNTATVHHSPDTSAEENIIDNTSEHDSPIIQTKSK